MATKSSNRIDIGINERDRKKIAEACPVFSPTATLYLKTHNFHWNVTGPMFQTLHVMFMGQYTEIWNALDMIAERIRSLGYPAPGSYKQFVACPPFRRRKGSKAKDMIRQLVAGQEAVTRTAREVFKVVEKPMISRPPICSPSAWKYT